MPKRKKYPKLPNGYGSIRYLGKGRRNPYAVHPPTTEFTLDGQPMVPKALCYVDDWIKGFTVLTAYKAGTYTPGMEKTLEIGVDSRSDLASVAQRILADYNLVKGVETQEKSKTFKEVYEEFYHWKFETDQSREYAKSTLDSTKTAFKNSASLHDKTFADLRHQDLQDVVDNCPLKHASKELIVSLFHQMYGYAEIYELCEKDYSAHVKINTEDDDEHGVPFTDTELKTLWAHKDNDTVAFILIMCYSGFRIQAYKTIEVNLKENYFKGGVKTRSSKQRTVPIHSGIRSLVVARMKKYGQLLGRIASFRESMYDTLESLGITKHTPHDCRHTFSRLCEKYGVNENDRKRMLGHSFGSDITNRIYGHRTLEDLRVEIEKIKICD